MGQLFFPGDMDRCSCIRFRSTTFVCLSISSILCRATCECVTSFLLTSTSSEELNERIIFTGPHPHEHSSPAARVDTICRACCIFHGSHPAHAELFFTIGTARKPTLQEGRCPARRLLEHATPTHRRWHDGGVERCAIPSLDLRWYRKSGRLGDWHWGRKPLSATINILSGMLYGLFEKYGECIRLLDMLSCELTLA